MLKMRMLSIRCTLEKLQPNAQPGDEVTYNGHYQNTGIFLLKYLGRPDGGKVLNKAKTAYDVIGVPERILCIHILLCFQSHRLDISSLRHEF